MRDMAQTPLMSSRLRTSENGLSMLPENSTMGGGPTSPTVGGPTTPALQRPGRTTTDSMMGDDSMMGTPSMMGGAAPVGTPIQQRVVEVAVENTGPGMFRLTATPDAGGSYMMRAAVGSLGPDSGFLQVLHGPATYISLLSLLCLIEFPRTKTRTVVSTLHMMCASLTSTELPMNP